MAFQNIFVGENVQGFKTSSKFEAVDMVILNIDDDNYVSSPYARIVDQEAWERNSFANGNYVFEYDSWSWVLVNYSYSDSDLINQFGIETHFATGYDSPKAGDKITVVYVKERLEQSSNSNQNQEPQILLTCELTRSGSTLEGNCPLCKPDARQTIADNLLRSLKGMSYQPYTATSAEVNPLAELGDGITAHGVYGGLYQQDLYFNSLMNSDIAAPADEELDHEFTYESATERRYKRKFADVGAEIRLFSDEISARVTRTGTGDGFGWSLIETAFSIYQTNHESDPIFLVDRTGLHVKGDGTFTGTVEAADFIGGTIKIGRTWAGNDETGPDIEEDESGNRYKYNFWVDRNGNVVARGLDLKGGSIRLGQRYGVESDEDQYNFEVSNRGAVKAYSLDLAGGSINLGKTLDAQGNEIPVFQVDSRGNVNARSLNLVGGTINLGEYDLDNGTTVSKFSVDRLGNVKAYGLSLNGGSINIGQRDGGGSVFSVSSSGNVTAYSLSLRGGSISIGEADGGGANFYVSPNGDLTANNGTFKGNVYAGNIQYGGGYGTFDGYGLTPSSISYSSNGALGVEWFNGALGGNRFKSMTEQNYIANWVAANHIICYSPGNISGTHYGLWNDDTKSQGVYWHTATIPHSVDGSFTPTDYEYIETEYGYYQVPIAYEMDVWVGNDSNIEYLGS